MKKRGDKGVPAYYLSAAFRCRAGSRIMGATAPGAIAPGAIAPGSVASGSVASGLCTFALCGARLGLEGGADRLRRAVCAAGTDVYAVCGAVTLFIIVTAIFDLAVDILYMLGRAGVARGRASVFGVVHDYLRKRLLCNAKQDRSCFLIAVHIMYRTVFGYSFYGVFNGTFYDR